MRLAMSSAAPPGRTPAELASACGLRGVAGIELVLAGVPDLDAARSWRALDLAAVALRVGTADGTR